MARKLPALQLLLGGIFFKPFAASQDIEIYSIVTADWYPHALVALECAVADEDVYNVPDTDSRLCRENTTNLTMVRTDDEMWKAIVRLAAAISTPQVGDNIMNSPLLVLVGQSAAKLFNQLSREQLGTLRKAVLIHTFMTPEILRICSITGNFLYTSAVACFGFEMSYAGFLVGAAAALVPWTKKAIAVISDAEIDAGDDYIFKAVTNGVKYIDPALSVIRRHVRTGGKSPHVADAAVYAEVAHLLDESSVVYLDLSQRSTVHSAMAAVQAYKESGVVSKPYAILPPHFQGFGPDGTPELQVTLNNIAIDMVRAIKNAIQYRKALPPIGATLLSVAKGYVSTLWTQPFEPVAADVDNQTTWLLPYRGDYQQVPKSVMALAGRACGAMSTVEFLNTQVAEVMKSSGRSDDSHDSVCEVNSECCAPVQTPSLKESWNPGLRCGPSFCGADFIEETEGYPRACLGDERGYHGCPRSDVTRLIGLGVFVNNIAELSMTSGSFFVDFNVYVFEQEVSEFTNQTGPVLMKSDSVNCNFNGLQKGRYFKDAQEFWDLLTLVGTDRWLSAFPVTVDDNTPAFTNVRGTMYFETNLNNWPFDVQNLDLAFDVAAISVQKKVKMCIMQSYTTFSSNIRLAGVRTASSETLVMEPKISTMCWPPYAYPVNRCKKFASDVPSALCLECDDPSVQATPYAAEESCKCMGGGRPSERAIFSIRFMRPPGRMLISIFLPPVAIIALNQAVLWLRVQASETRVLMSSSACVASVMYHVTISSSTPPTAREVTKADILMTICYGVNLAILLTALMQYLTYFQEDEELREFVEQVLYYRSRTMIMFLTLIFGGSIYFVDSVWQVVLLYLMLMAVYTCAVLSGFCGFFQEHPHKREALKEDVKEALRRMSFKLTDSFGVRREPFSSRSSRATLPDIQEHEQAAHIEMADLIQQGGASREASGALAPPQEGVPARRGTTPLISASAAQPRRFATS